LEPVWNNLGELYKDKDKIVISKMDVSINAPPPSISITGFPTLILFPSSNKHGIPYFGNYDLQSFIKFIQKHSSVGYDFFKNLYFNDYGI